MAKEECNCNNSFGVASVILGIIGSVLGIFVLPIILSIIGLIFGIVQLKKEKNSWAILGIVLSIFGIIISIYAIWSVISAISGFQQSLATCQANPSAPGCEQITSLLAAQGAT